MNDIAKCNTKEGIHQRAKEVKMKPWVLGCQCFDCCKEFDKIVGITVDGMLGVNTEQTATAAVKRNEEEYKRIWNAAIEAAAEAALEYLNSKNYKGTNTTIAIRKLKI
jgi:hypothetical protein